MNHKISGFTLIELLITVAILGILMGAVVMVIDPARRMREAYDGNARSNMIRFAEAVEACYLERSTYLDCDSVVNLQTRGLLKSGYRLKGHQPTVANNFRCYTGTTKFCVRYYREADSTWMSYQNENGEVRDGSCTGAAGAAWRTVYDATNGGCYNY